MFFFVLYWFYKQNSIFIHYKRNVFTILIAPNEQRMCIRHTSNEILKFSQNIDLPKLQATHAVAAAAAMVPFFARWPPMFQRFTI